MSQEPNAQNRYIVTIPIAGRIVVEVEADSKEAAKEAAWDKLHAGAADEEGADIEWEFYDKLVEGNVCRSCWTQTEVEEDPR